MFIIYFAFKDTSMIPAKRIDEQQSSANFSLSLAKLHREVGGGGGMGIPRRFDSCYANIIPVDLTFWKSGR